MEINISPGISFTAKKKVEMKDTAANYGSGLVEVFATPAMIALMENAALNTVLPYLKEGQSTVGFEVNIRHLKPTPVGMFVESTATLTEVNGKKLVFQVTAYDETGKIGEGAHTRYIIDARQFIVNLNKK